LAMHEYKWRKVALTVKFRFRVTLFNDIVVNASVTEDMLAEAKCTDYAEFLVTDERFEK